MRTLSLCLLVLAMPLAARAQDGPVDPVKVLAPYVDENTYVIGVVDLQNVGLEALLDRLATVGTPKDEVAKMKRIALETRQELVGAGGRYVCFTLNLDDRFDDGPLLVIPAGGGGKAQQIADALGKFGIQAKVNGNTVLAGKAKILAAAMERKAAAVPALAKALAAVEGMPTRVAGTIPSAFRKSLEELSPTLPKELGGGSIAPVSRGVSWGAVGADLSAEKLQLRAIVQARDATDAADLRRLADKVIATLREAAAEGPREFAKGLQELRPDVKESQLRLTLDSKAVDAAIMPMFAKMREAAVRTQSTNNLKQIGLAMHSYYDVNKTLPAQSSYDKKKRPLLSWRVHLLPYLDQLALYKEFKLDESWDSPNNKPLIAKMPAVLRSPSIVNADPGKTTYLVPVGPDLIFDGPKKTKLAQITDGTSNTIMVVEADESRAVWWTQPEDYKVDKKNPKLGLIRTGASGFNAGFADGWVRYMSRAITDEVLWMYFTPSGGEPIPD